MRLSAVSRGEEDAQGTHCDGHGDGAAGRVPELIEASGLPFDPTAVPVLRCGA